MIKLSVIGFGGYGWDLIQHIEQAQQSLDCRLVAAADVRLGNLADKAARLQAAGAELFDDPQAMLDSLRGRCDAVYIATSIQSHADLAVAAAERGYHIHLEKPPAATVQEVDRIAEAVDRAGVLCLVGFQAVQGTDCRFLKDRIVAGRLGEITSLTCCAGWPRPASYYARNDWAGRLRAGGAWVLDGPATNALSHQVNNLLHLASREAGGYATPTAVRAELYAAGAVESHNIAAIEMQTDCGPTVHCMLAHCNEEFFGPIIAVEGTAGRAVWKVYGDVRVDYADGSSEQYAYARDDQSETIANFVAALRSGDGSPLRCKLADARKTIVALNATHESSRRIHRIPAEAMRTVAEDGNDSRVVVAGLDGLLRSAAEQHCLLSGLADAPGWTVPTETFDTTGYNSFPRHFCG